MTQLPSIDLCVLRDDDNGWQVVQCDSTHPGRVLGTFPSFSAASEFVFQERDRRQAAGQSVPRVHFPDDCTCYQSNACDPKA